MSGQKRLKSEYFCNSILFQGCECLAKLVTCCLVAVMLVDANICPCNSSAMVPVKVPAVTDSWYPEERGSAKLGFCTVPKVLNCSKYYMDVFAASCLNQHNLEYHDGGLRL